MKVCQFGLVNLLVAGFFFILSCDHAGVLSACEAQTVVAIFSSPVSESDCSSPAHLSTFEDTVNTELTKQLSSTYVSLYLTISREAFKNIFRIFHWIVLNHFLNHFFYHFKSVKIWNLQWKMSTFLPSLMDFFYIFFFETFHWCHQQHFWE